MATGPLRIPAKLSYLLYTFTSNGTDYEFVEYTTDVSTFDSEPTFEIELPEFTGGMEENEANIKVPVTASSLFDNMSQGIPHAPVDITVQEVIVDPAGVESNKTLTLFVGTVLDTVKNYQGQRESILIRCLGEKPQLNVALGFQCNHQCSHRFGDDSCGVDKEAVKETGTIDAIDGKTVTITGLSTRPVLDGRYWHRGFVRLNGLEIGIREWDPAVPTVFYMVRQVPSSWASASVEVVPGCDLTRQTCEDRWSNEDNFLGIGFAIPPYDPSSEIS